jgi:heme-degrading monooxygenase HmoA
MPSVIILARVEIPAFDLGKTDTYFRQLIPALDAVDGFISLDFWEGVIHPERKLMLHHYRDFDSARIGLEVLTGQRLFIEAIGVSNPADVTQLHVKGSHGQPITAIPKGKLLSVSRRIAGPGFGEELSIEIANIFDELAMIPGYLGSAYGHNETLAEEVVGLVAWESQAAFESSVPTGTLYELNLYRRAI